jgi:hypothetical protein
MSTVNPAQLSISQPDMNSANSSANATPEAGATKEASSESKKRKNGSWGAPVGEFKRVIGPRKRAKTEEEKVQRQKERTLRNRRAAEASRQRKAEQYNLIERQRDYLQELVAKCIEQNTTLIQQIRQRYPSIKAPEPIKFDVDLVHERPENTIKSEAQKKKDVNGPTDAIAVQPITANVSQPSPSAMPTSQTPSPMLTVLDDMNSSVGNSSAENTPATVISDDFGDIEPKRTGQVNNHVEFECLFDGEPGDIPARYLISGLHARLSKRSIYLMNLLFRLVFR